MIRILLNSGLRTSGHPAFRMTSAVTCIRRCSTSGNDDDNKKRVSKQEPASGSGSAPPSGPKAYEVIGINFRDIVEPGAKAPATIKHLNVKDGIRKATKKGSMIRDMFVQRFDSDFLTYPELLKSRHQYNELMRQSQGIHKYFKQLVMSDPGKQLSSFGFHNLWFLTKTEMVNIFESVGQSMAHRLVDYDTSGQKDEPVIGSSIIHPIVEPGNVRHILSLILNNCALACIDSTSQQSVRDKLYRELNQKKDLKIGFAWSESWHMRPGKEAASDFVSTIKLTVDQKYLLVSGEKDGLLAGDDYDYFLFFGRTRDYGSQRRPEYLLQQDIPYDGLIGCLVPADQIAVTERFTESGIEWMRIKVSDLMLPVEEFQVLEPEVDGVSSHNYKSLVKLSMAALMVGQMKATMQDVNKFLVEQKALLMSCDAVARATADMVTDLYTAESCLYYSTAMFDQLDQGLYPEIHLEASLTSIITHSAVESFYANAREILGLSGKIGPIMDLNHLLRHFLESEDASRLKVVRDGMDLLMEQKGKWVGRFAYSPRLKERSLLELAPHTYSKVLRKHIMKSPDDFRPYWDLQGHIHPTFEREAGILEKMVKLVNYCAEITITANKGQINTERQHDDYLISDVVLMTFGMLCTMARASRAYIETLRNADMDVEMVKVLVDRIECRYPDLMDEIEGAVPGRETHRLASNVYEFRRTGKSYYINDILDPLSKDPRSFDPFDNIDPKVLDSQRDLTPGSEDKYL